MQPDRDRVTHTQLEEPYTRPRNAEANDANDSHTPSISLDRRRLLTTLGGFSAIGLAGCSGDGDSEGEPDDTDTDENATAHDEVLRAVLQSDGGRTVIPMRFGMVFKTENALKNVLRNGRVAFRRSLNDLDGMVELGVKLVTKEDGTVDRPAVVEDVATRLRDVADTEAANDRYSDRLVFNRSYLVGRDDQPAFDDAVGEIRDEYDESLHVQYNGPWAPYNFVDIEIGAEGR
ncbi:MAG: GvpL/GvpF family gas vesicle protein [Halohasta sp.]